MPAISSVYPGLIEEIRFSFDKIQDVMRTVYGGSFVPRLGDLCPPERILYEYSKLHVCPSLQVLCASCLQLLYVCYSEVVDGKPPGHFRDDHMVIIHIFMMPFSLLESVVLSMLDSF